MTIRLHNFLFGCLLIAVTGISNAATGAVIQAHACSDSQESLQYWQAVRSSAAKAAADDLILPLANCLQSPNPELRDRIAYEVITYWLRNDLVSEVSVGRLRTKLIPWLSRGVGTDGEDSAFARAFAAVILSEVLRHDSLTHSMAGEEVFELHKAANEMFRSERDYRGLTEQAGWIHTIAHGADLLWRLAMHPLLNRESQRELLTALSVQLTRLGIPAYTFNESDRMARVVLALLARGDLSEKELSVWIASVAEPGELESWNAAFASPVGMAKLHNQKQFLRALKEGVGDANPAVVKSLDLALQGLP